VVGMRASARVLLTVPLLTEFNNSALVQVTTTASRGNGSCSWRPRRSAFLLRGAGRLAACGSHGDHCNEVSDIATGILERLSTYPTLSFKDTVIPRSAWTLTGPLPTLVLSERGTCFLLRSCQTADPPRSRNRFRRFRRTRGCARDDSVSKVTY